MWPPELADLHFLRPLWLAGIPLAIALAVFLARRGAVRSRWLEVIDPRLRPALLDTDDQAPSRRLSIAIAIALSLASLILAGPAWQRLPQPVIQRDDALVMVLDLSLSMYAADLEPSRLTLARHKLVDVLRKRKEGHTALVAYAGDAHVVVPLTDDTATIENLLGALAPAMMPALGSNVGAALDLAYALVRSAGVDNARILLVTDGIDHLADLTEHCSSSTPLEILGVGTPEGAPIPLAFVEQPGRFLTDRAGRRIVARLDDDRLEQAASLCGGRYARIEVGDDDIDTLLNATAEFDTSETAGRRAFDQWVDAGQYLVLALAPFALLGFRRGVVLALLVTVATPADASWWDDLWLRRDQQGVAALRSGEPERAEQLFDDPQWQGVARYRSGGFDAAEARFETDPSARGHYNRGNALARQGRYEDAIAAYDSAIAHDPADEDPRFNRELVERAMRQKEKSEGQSNQRSDQRRDRTDPAQDPDSAESRAGDRADDETPSPSEEPGEPQQQPGEDAGARPDQQADAAETDQPRDEQQDTLDRWLRRIPDDPGGLLRRKFQYETNQRMRQGQYPPREEKIW